MCIYEDICICIYVIATIVLVIVIPIVIIGMCLNMYMYIYLFIYRVLPIAQEVNIKAMPIEFNNRALLEHVAIKLSVLFCLLHRR